MTILVPAAFVLGVTPPPAVADSVWIHRTWYEQVNGIAGALLSIVLIACALYLALVARQMRRRWEAVSGVIERARIDVAPILAHVRSIAGNIDHMTGSIRGDVERLQGTVAAANSSLREALAATERRLGDFNALLEVVQQEAEGLFVSTAATVRGVRTGASHFAGGDGPEIASVEADDDGLEAAVDDEEIDDGNDGLTNDDAHASRAPRIRRRAGTNR